MSMRRRRYLFQSSTVAISGLLLWAARYRSDRLAGNELGRRYLWAGASAIGAGSADKPGGL